MNRILLFLFVCFVIVLTPRLADGHGDAIRVNQINNKLTVSHVPNNFPPLVIAEDDADGVPREDVTFLPGIGEIVFWQVPAFEINGLNNNSSLSIEPLARPVKDMPTELRLAWYWDPATQLVETSPADLKLIGTGLRSTTLAATAETGPGPFLLANPIGSQQGIADNHGLLSYAVDNDPVAPLGAYAFFARMTSSAHDPSDSFLIVLNNGIDFGDMVTAATAIENAAAPQITFPLGDYNHNGTVDAADYTVWRDGLGDKYIASDYQVWKDHFGQTASGAGSAGVGSQSVPEPGSLTLSASLFLGILVKLAKRRRYVKLSLR